MAKIVSHVFPAAEEGHNSRTAQQVDMEKDGPATEEQLLLENPNAL